MRCSLFVCLLLVCVGVVATSGIGMLSTQKNSMSSSARSAVLLPAPDSPVTITICIYSTASIGTSTVDSACASIARCS